MSKRTQEAIAARERKTRGEPEPRKKPAPKEPDGAEGK